jgi:hypothetical protein
MTEKTQETPITATVRYSAEHFRFPREPAWLIALTFAFPFGVLLLFIFYVRPF